MQVGMLQFLHHRIILAQQVRSKGYRQCQLSRTLRSAKHDGMRQTPFLDHLHQALLHLLLSYDLTKIHQSIVLTP